MTELINLSFNIHCYSLVADFSDLNAVGRQDVPNKANGCKHRGIKEP
jgi:hypothetical protein